MARELLDDDAVERRLAGVLWRREGSSLVKSFEFEDFAASMAFVNRVADLAEERNHHPDIAISWNRVTLRSTTHDRGGLTELDFEIARAVDAMGTGREGLAADRDVPFSP